MISDFKLSKENYSIVWRLLNDNKVMLIENHLEELLTFRQSSKKINRSPLDN